MRPLLMLLCLRSTTGADMRWIAAAIALLALSIVIAAYRPFHHPAPSGPQNGYWGQP